MCSGGITTRAPTGLSHRNTVPTARPVVHTAGRDLPAPASSTQRPVRLSSMMNLHTPRRCNSCKLREIYPLHSPQLQNPSLLSRNDRAHHSRNKPARLQYCVGGQTRLDQADDLNRKFFRRAL